MIDLMRDHLINMTDVQRKVCVSVVDEWNVMVARVAFLESENAKLIHDVSRLTHDVTSMREASKLRYLVAGNGVASKRGAARTRTKLTAKKAKAKR
jgi:hypothetical protein